MGVAEGVFDLTINLVSLFEMGKLKSGACDAAHSTGGIGGAVCAAACATRHARLFDVVFFIILLLVLVGLGFRVYMVVGEVFPRVALLFRVQVRYDRARACDAPYFCTVLLLFLFLFLLLFLLNLYTGRLISNLSRAKLLKSTHLCLLFFNRYTF